MSLGTDLAPNTWIVNRNHLPWVKAKVVGKSSVGDMEGYAVELDHPWNGNGFLPFANLGGWEVMEVTCLYLEEEDGHPVCAASDPGADPVKCYNCPTTTKRA